MTFNEKAKKFLAQERIAVAGVSRSGEQTGNFIYKKLRDEGYEVFAVHPQAETLEGDPSYPNMQAIPGGVHGAIIVTNPEVTSQVVQDCQAAGVPRVWMHNNTFMPSSVSDEAVAFCEKNGIEVIAGGCPMMFMDFGHKCMRVVLGMAGRLPN